MTRIDGTTAPGFEAVADAFAAAFDGKPEMGAALAIRRHGRLVVDLWGGLADPRDGRPWERDTASVVFSCTKGVMSILAARLVQEGALDYDAPASSVWPEFAAAGKGGARVGDLLAHRAGLSCLRTPVTFADLLDWERMTGILAAEEPLWEPGAGWAYHAITHGWLAGELIRRASGRRAGEYLQDIVGPLGAATWVGLPASERSRVAWMTAGPTQRRFVQDREAAHADGSLDRQMLALTLGGALPADLLGDEAHPGFNDPRIQRAEVPGAGGISTARSLATIWSATVVETEGVRLLDDDVLDRALAPRSEGAPVFDAPPPWPRWGSGFQLDSAARRYLGPASLGHDGAGGQVAFADREHEVGFAFLRNQLEAIDDTRATAIVESLRACL